MNEQRRVASSRPEPGVLLLTFDRPEVRNALDAVAFAELTSSLDAAAADDKVGAVVLTGAPGAFCAGADLRSLGDNHGRVDQPSAAEVVERFPKPMLAAVNGAAVGFGFTVLLLCDLVLVARGARLRAPFVPLGLAPDAASSRTLPERVGWQRAAHLFLTGGWLEADDAVASGIAWAIEPPDSLLAATVALAAEIAAMPRAAVVETKQLLVRSRRAACADAREAEQRAFARLVRR